MAFVISRDFVIIGRKLRQATVIAVSVVVVTTSLVAVPTALLCLFVVGFLELFLNNFGNSCFTRERCRNESLAAF